MTRYLSETEMERIKEFANTPEYRRSPEQLLPDRDASTEDSD